MLLQVNKADRSADAENDVGKLQTMAKNIFLYFIVLRFQHEPEMISSQKAPRDKKIWFPIISPFVGITLYTTSLHS